ncbi:MAG: ribonuclease J [Beijerinckiaceae bacterium]|nr:ribonuclease J [Beijerinckiaceae bacterium]
MTRHQDELVFVPLGGLGEIGMNAALYGFGPPRARKWILVDCGLAFAGPDLPGIDLIMPDLTFIEGMRKDLLALIITHAHEDHVGAIAQMWPRLRCPIYATQFAADLLVARRLGDEGAPDVDMRIYAPGDQLVLGPFAIEPVRMAHSIPESIALAIRTDAGLIVHSGDWKIDPTPVAGWATDEARLRQLGDEGVLALISDSTNILRPGESPSETDVGLELGQIIEAAPGRVVVTTFASNVARMRSVGLAAERAGRTVVVVGRAMERVSQVARQNGYLDGVPEFMPANSFANLPRDKMVLLATGSQGEPRGAMARIADDDHPTVKLAKGDTVIFSSRPIPGNEREIGGIINRLVRQGLRLITDRDALVHVSGHPRRDEVRRLYEWLRPKIAVPAHGEALHLYTHADFAREMGVEKAIVAMNGETVLLGPGAPAIVDEVPHGRMLLDGNVLVRSDDEAVRARRKLAFSGVISIGVALTSKGELAGDPDVMMAGLPARARDGRSMDEIVDKAVFETIDNLPRGRRRDPDDVATAIERSVRNTVRGVWGKRPQVHVLVMQV